MSAEAASPKVKSVANPPRAAKNHFKVTINGSAPRVTLYLSTDRRIGAGDKRVSAKGRLKHGKGKLSVSLPKHLSPNAYFLLACPGKSHRGCASSRTPMVLAPSGPVSFPTASVATDAAHATSQTVGVRGGSISVAGADGTRFDLTIPANSIDDGTQITLTPVSSLSGPAKLGHLVAGVEVGANLLTFARGATLKITPPRNVAVRNRRAASFGANGAGIHEVPFVDSHVAIVLGVTQPGGFALMEVGKVGNAGRAAARATAHSAAAGGGVSAFYEQLIARLLDQLRASRHEPTDGSQQAADFNKAAQSVLKDWVDDVMQHEVPPGLKEDTAADIAIRDLNEYAHVYSVLGFGSVDGEVFPTDRRLTEGKYKRAQERCAANHNLKEIGDNILFDNRQLIVFYGGSDHSLDELFKCARFRVEIDSDITETAPSPDSGSFHFHHISTIDVLQMDAGSLKWHGSGQGSFSDASGSFTSSTFCGMSSDMRQTTSTITGSNGGTTTIPNFRFPIMSDDPDQSYVLSMSSDATENYHIESTGCGFPDSSSDTTDTQWFMALTSGHSGIGEGSDSQVDFHLDAGAGEVIAQRSYSLGGGSEQTTVTVTHTPPTP